MNLKYEFLNQALEDIAEIKVITVAVKLESGAIEVITNTEDTFNKAHYYAEKYDNDFKLKSNPNIQIVGFMIV